MSDVSERPRPGSPESQERHMAWLYGEGGLYPFAGEEPCRCEHAYKSLGRLHGTDMGKGWVRMTTHPQCLHHGPRGRTAERIAQADWSRRKRKQQRRVDRADRG